MLFVSNAATLILAQRQMDTVFPHELFFKNPSEGVCSLWTVCIVYVCVFFFNVLGKIFQKRINQTIIGIWVLDERYQSNYVVMMSIIKCVYVCVCVCECVYACVRHAGVHACVCLCAKWV